MLRKWHSVVACLLSTTAVFGASVSDREFIPHIPTTPAVPFSDAVVVGDVLYLSGAIGFDQKTGSVPEDAAVEARQAIGYLKANAERAGFSLDDVVSVQVFCTDLHLYDVFNAEYVKFFRAHFPARAMIGVHELIRGSHFELTAVAIRRKR
jgi:2-iminobutanoate/2-iminopropanoate deaminase